MPSRRALIKASAALTLLAPFARLAGAASNPDARFVLVILRGGLDGLAAVPPYGDPRYASVRGVLALPPPAAEGGVRKLDGLFGLHPALANLHAMYRSGELAVIHAAATPYRERSHFDGQKVLEAGLATPTASAGGWLNRALTALTAEGAQREALAIGGAVPLVLRGEFAVNAWTPSRLPDADADTLARVRELYEAADPRLAERLGDALAARAIAGDAMPGRRERGGGAELAPLAASAARFLRRDNGPRIAVLEVGGWDTHANQGAAQGPLALRLRALDAGLQTLKSELGEVWRQTAVLVVTEFGRTVAANGTRGTDHGTAGCAFLLGGTVAGGRLIVDWPGLAPGSLHEGRDLRATLDLRAVLKGVLAEGFGLAEEPLARSVFPDSAAVRPLAVLRGLG